MLADARRVGYVEIARELEQVGPEEVLVPAHGREDEWRAAAQLAEGVDEGAPTEVRLGEPETQPVEDGEDPVPGAPAVAGDVVGEPGAPTFVARVEIRRNQVLLGRVELVEPLERDACGRADLVDADGLDASGVVQGLSRIQQPFGVSATHATPPPLRERTFSKLLAPRENERSRPGEQGESIHGRSPALPTVRRRDSRQE